MNSNGQGDAAAPGFAFAHVYNPKLEAGRGEQFSASAVRERQEAAIKAAWDAGDDFQLPMGRVDDALDTDGLQQASLEASIPSSNRGFQMLQKMGWSEGKGLGASEDGIVEPVRAGMEAGLRLGLGKAEQESFYISAENVTRKRLETEVQADEDYERTLKREVRHSTTSSSSFIWCQLLMLVLSACTLLYTYSSCLMTAAVESPQAERWHSVLTCGCTGNAGTSIKQSITAAAWCAPAA